MIRVANQQANQSKSGISANWGSKADDDRGGEAKGRQDGDPEEEIKKN